METPVGFLGLYADATVLRRIDFLPPEALRPDPGEATQPIQLARQQLTAYFRDPQAPFSLPLDPLGTPFQRRVWAALERIPPGQVRTYGELARTLGSGPRAVAGACRANPLPIVIPCHRVVAADGPGGYAGASRGGPVALKRWLLAHESGYPTVVPGGTENI